MKTLGCGDCKHLSTVVQSCAAYPRGIPFPILSGEVDHLRERPGQVSGILFEHLDDTEQTLPVVIRSK